MKLKSMEFNDNKNGPEPTGAVVELTIEEMALIFKWVGSTNHLERNDVVPGGGAIGAGIYDTLTHVFNLYWENGITDYLRSR